MPKEKRIRVQFDFGPSAYARLKALKAKTEASSNVEVMKNALRLYEGLIAETESGSTFLIRGKSGQVAPFRLFL